MSIKTLALATPEPGQLTRVNDYVYWLRMPLPFDLDHINLYLIRDENGWAIVDTGLGTDNTLALWEQIFDTLAEPITKVIVTHMHPDHIGNAGALVDKFKVPLYMTFGEYFVARAIVAGPRGASTWQDQDHLRKCGMDDDYIERASQNKNSISQVVKPIPLQYKRLIEGQVLRLGGIQWQIIIGQGHSPEHVCLYAPSIKTLISGDHILPKITPNIGTYSTEPDANALALYLQTLTQFKQLPPDTQVLPAHKLPFKGLHQRVDELIHHHHGHLQRLLAHCHTGRTVKECLSVLFSRELNPHNMMFALAEALSHLNYLYYQGKVDRNTNAKGQWLFNKRL